MFEMFDPVGLVVDCEDQFGVTIDDAEAEKTETPNMLCDLICSKLTLTDDPTCQSQKAFYIVRRALAEHTDARRADIRPDTEINRLLPTEDARDIWPALKTSAEARRWPALKRPLWLKLCMLGLAGCVVFMFCMFLYIFGMAAWAQAVLAVTLLPPALIAFACLVERSTGDMKKIVPSRFRRVRDLIPYAKSSDQIEWTRPLVAVMIKELILDMICEPESSYREDASFVKYYNRW